jgi:hypothetical protein
VLLHMDGNPTNRDLASTRACTATGDEIAGNPFVAPHKTNHIVTPIPRRTATAVVHVDRCFKGERPAIEIVPVLFGHILPVEVTVTAKT